ncbi:MAG: GMC family oxidoreductase N-terminal domain-containing protein, partial [Deltaproteobacteria bacterium]|nr:GMC family oxidoreductase N-terminal domain-containing protein [Deltaproteobacteria bacterium]
MIVTGADRTADVEVSCDVCVIGSGAGGSVVAAGLAERGLSVVMLEEGGSHSRAEFTGEEDRAYPMLYQERGTRATADLAITILQGRSVGGGTTVNWTTCFRTPDRILAHWREVHGLEGIDSEAMRPHFEAVEARLNIGPWSEALVNRNNRVLLDGARKLGWQADILRRNVKGCGNTGYCGLGCPLDAKQGMHLTYIPDALAAGMVLHADTRVTRIETAGGRVVAVHGETLASDRDLPSGPRVVVRPKVTVLSGGAINSPALLLRSGLGDGPVGRRTMLHPVVAVSGRYADRVEGWSGAPQSVASHQFVDRGADQVGFFLETPPLHPMLAATALPMFGDAQRAFLSELAHTSSLIAVTVDGLLPGDVGGVVTLRRDGRPKLDYPVKPALAEAWKAAHVAMAQLHFAAGAEQVASNHVETMAPLTSMG